MKFNNIALVAAGLLLAGCATQMVETVQPDAPGFFMGLLHGVVVFFSLIWSLFDPSVSLFATPNNGGWYAFGFALGVGGLGKGIDLILVCLFAIFGESS